LGTFRYVLGKDDGVQLANPTAEGEANSFSLAQAQY